MELPSIFQVAVDEKLIHRYVTWVRNSLRTNVAHTKTRGEVAGGGKKPWRQKGTGRARSGSSRNPLWRHGGTIFGPRNETTYATRMPRQERRKAFMGALSAKANGNAILILDGAIEAPKTKTMATLLKTLPGTTGKKVLHIGAAEDAALQLSLRNLAKVDVTTVSELNVLDVMNHDILLMTKDGIAMLDQHFTPTV